MREVYDAFSEGVTIGGMRTRVDVRILLCYVLKSLGGPFSKTNMNEALQSTALANFFEVNDALAALERSGLIEAQTEAGDVYYTLTPAGADVADRLETDLPLSARRAALSAAAELLAREKARGGAKVEIRRLQKGYHAVLSVYDGDTLMMQTVLYAADSLQANEIGERFLRDPAKLYTGIVDLVTK